MTEKAKAELTNDIAAVLNKHCAENPSNTPDTILAAYLVGCLQTWNDATTQRERWYGRAPDNFPTMKTSEKVLALCHAIEAAGASEQLTKCSVLASEIRAEVIALEAVAARCPDKAVEFPECGSKAWINREVERSIEKND